MKQYKSHKIVHAEPMNAVAWFNHEKGIAVLDNINATADGYHVVYDKGSDEEYHSWSPKKAFDEGYTEWNDFNFDEPETCETCSS